MRRLEAHVGISICYEGLDQQARLQEQRMDPKPDYGYDSYRGTGKLKNKVHKHSTSYVTDCCLM